MSQLINKFCNKPKPNFSLPIFIFFFVVINLPVGLSHAKVVKESANKLSGKIKIIDMEGEPVSDASDAVIFVEGLVNEPYEAKSPVIMSHKGKQFAPRVVPLRKGDHIDFINDDGVYHNVFSLSRVKPFDLGVYPEGTSKVVSFDDPGLIKIYCNLHPQMISNILVLNNDYYSVTNPKGHFQINNLPLGEYTLRVWHELSREWSQTITIKPGENSVSNITLKLSKKILQHKNKFGKDYKNKY